MTIDDLRAMLKPYDPDLMKAYEVSRVVNSVKNDTPACIEPVRDQGAAINAPEVDRFILTVKGSDESTGDAGASFADR